MVVAHPGKAWATSWAGAAAVAAVALLASVAGLLNAFAWDDVHLVELNGRFHSLAGWREILGASFWPPPYSQDLYRPATGLLLTLQHIIGGGDPMVFRLVSYGLYAACAVMLLRVAALWLPPAAALWAALLFAAHPVHVEAVAPAVGQAELVVALAALLMIRRYVAARQAGGPTGGDWAVLATLCLWASLSKEQGLLLPALLLLVELCPPAGLGVPAWRRLAPGYAGLLAAAVVVLLLRRVVLGHVAGTFVAEALEGLDLRGRVYTMLPVVTVWLRLLAWPAHLQADYSPQELTAAAGFGLPQAAGAAVLLAALAAAWGGRRIPGVAFGLGWCAVALLPVSNVLIPTGILVAERTLFLPSAGLLIAVAGGLSAAGVSAGIPRRTMLGLGAVLVAAGVLRSAERQRVWRHEAFFAVRTVQDAPRSYRAQRAYGEVLFALGQDRLAEEAYETALALAPAGHAWRVRNDLARRYRAMDRPEQESEQLEASLMERPDQEDARGYLATAYLVLGRYKEASEQADIAVGFGGNPLVFRELRALADSARAAGAPPGSVRVGVRIRAAPRRQ